MGSWGRGRGCGGSRARGGTGGTGAGTFARVWSREFWEEDAFTLADGKEGFPEGAADELAISVGAGGGDEVKRANKMAGGATEGELGGPGKVFDGVGSLVGGN